LSRHQLARLTKGWYISPPSHPSCCSSRHSMSEACPPRAPRTRMSERDMRVERRIRSAGREGEQSRRGFALSPAIRCR
jgi:hypothetical protein